MTSAWVREWVRVFLWTIAVDESPCVRSRCFPRRTRGRDASEEAPEGGEEEARAAKRARRAAGGGASGGAALDLDGRAAGGENGEPGPQSRPARGEDGARTGEGDATVAHAGVGVIYGTARRLAGEEGRGGGGEGGGGSGAEEKDAGWGGAEAGGIEERYDLIRRLGGGAYGEVRAGQGRDSHATALARANAGMRYEMTIRWTLMNSKVGY